MARTGHRGTRLAPLLTVILVLLGVAALLYWRVDLPGRFAKRVARETDVAAAVRDIYPSRYAFKPLRAMVYIPAGDFFMGSVCGGEDEQPVHRVAVDGFWMDRFEVTNKDYEVFDPSHRRYRKSASKADDHPAVHVTWDDAQAYCNWRCDKEGVPAGTYRLPTEAEWEYAARGGLDGREYPWGDTAPDAFELVQANFKSGGARNGAEAADADCTPVGSFRPNAFGLYDMAGNVWEWCLDWYDAKSYGGSGALSVNPTGPGRALRKVWRGGSWGSDAGSLRCAARGGLGSRHWMDNLGFRCVRDR